MSRSGMFDVNGDHNLRRGFPDYATSVEVFESGAISGVGAREWRCVVFFDGGISVRTRSCDRGAAITKARLLAQALETPLRRMGLIS